MSIGVSLSQRLMNVALGRLFALAGLAVLIGSASWFTLAGVFREVAIIASASMMIVVLVLVVMRSGYRISRDQNQKSIAHFISNDSAPSFITAVDGEISFLNEAAEKEYGPRMVGNTMAAALSERIVNPGAILFRLQSRAETAGSAREEIVTSSGQLTLAVHAIGPYGFAWRIDTLNSQAAGSHPSDNRILPMMMIGRGGAILSMNHAARQFIGVRCKSLDNVFAEQIVVPGTVMQVSTTSGNQPALIAQTEAGAGRTALYMLPPPDVGTPAQRPDWQVFQDMPIPMVKIAPDGTVLAFNKRASSLIGVVLAEGAHLSALMEGLGRSISGWLEDTLAGRLVQKSEFLRLTRADKEAFVQVTLNRIEEDGEAALIAVLHDATELKSLEAQFVQSQKMQAIGQLAGGVAHDFNNLLTAISGHCDLLLLRHDQGDSDYGDLVQINQNANRAAALVGQLLAFSRKQTLQPETLDMRDTLSDLTHLLNRLVGEKVTLSLCHDPVLKPIRADKRQLEQVLMNLVVNARDAMPAGGEIQVLTECITLSKPMHRDQVTVPAGEYVTIKVCDEGIGIPSDKLQKVFEPFFTTKRTGEGTGLGLSTAYGIIKQTGGYIFVDSKEGEGTCFMLFFPVLEQPKQLSNDVDVQLPKEARKISEGGVILLVEDEAPVRAFASRALRLRGFTVLEAENAEVALETLEDTSLKIDVFVTDVVMPGKDGPSWVREALEKRPDVRVVFVSGYAEDSLGEAQKKIPNSVFLPKPFSLNDLTDTVNRQLH
ncbi:ATP-binding protein [Sulfitobacter donghicola]|uniref:histidine kinase n=1 Tax=Sulfitobacter donghicola DSW-25 = KCTC 12864 = JCM 14565 TaxID=1300350 RepID=A0A073IG56_9RHOB|nr:ATP-binding protein [Sulfitobacter donghicola]KEJ88466.1 sensor histidine kinase [Sulfitobacter donghicola DSW-25 = KCTC 12864 = JCM 14565]KIN69660.1 Sensor kinase-like protein [Sulfitobacter donghicola DSW-25 = KCTC 12864 = JCM 14565]